MHSQNAENPFTNRPCMKMDRFSCFYICGESLTLWTVLWRYFFQFLLLSLSHSLPPPFPPSLAPSQGDCCSRDFETSKKSSQTMCLCVCVANTCSFFCFVLNDTNC